MTSHKYKNNPEKSTEFVINISILIIRQKYIFSTSNTKCTLKYEFT
jgi:hypothetical protein